MSRLRATGRPRCVCLQGAELHRSLPIGKVLACRLALGGRRRGRGSREAVERGGRRQDRLDPASIGVCGVPVAWFGGMFVEPRDLARRPVGHLAGRTAKTRWRPDAGLGESIDQPELDASRLGNVALELDKPRIRRGLNRRPGRSSRWGGRHAASGNQTGDGERAEKAGSSHDGGYTAGRRLVQEAPGCGLRRA